MPTDPARDYPAAYEDGRLSRQMEIEALEAELRELRKVAGAVLIVFRDDVERIAGLKRLKVFLGEQKKRLDPPPPPDSPEAYDALCAAAKAAGDREVERLERGLENERRERGVKS